MPLVCLKKTMFQLFTNQPTMFGDCLLILYEYPRGAPAFGKYSSKPNVNFISTVL